MKFHHLKAKSPYFIMGFGVVLFLISVFQHVTELSAIDQLVGPVIAFLLDGPPAIGLAYAGYWLTETELSSEDRWQVWIWCLAGAILFVTIMGLSILVRAFEGRVISEALFPLLIATEAGGIAGVVGGYQTARARTEARRAQSASDALRERTRQLQAVLDGVEAAIWIRDTDSRFVLVNQKFRTLFGIDYETEVSGKRPEEVLPQEATEQFCDNDQQVLETEQSVELEETIETGEAQRTFLTRITPLFEDGDLYATCGIASDITERKAYEQELRAEQEFVTQMLDTLDDIVYVYSPELELERWNDRLAEVTGYTGEELEGMAPTDFFPPDEQSGAAAALEELTTTGSATFEGSIQTADGERIPYELSGSKMTDSDGAVLGLVGIGRDITEQKEYEQTIEQQNERLEQFASVVSHDLRNPLNVADGRLELARGECDSEHLEDVNRALDRMDALIDDLLTLAREAEEAPDPEPVSLAAMTESCWANVDTRNATLVTDFDRTIYAGESLLKRVFENLIRNSIEHGTDDVTVTIGELDDGFFVEDDGPGIPEAERDDVFDAGYSTSDEGTGFGLSIVEQVVDAHGWEIHVTEGSEGGARFEVTGISGA